MPKEKPKETGITRSRDIIFPKKTPEETAEETAEETHREWIERTTKENKAKIEMKETPLSEKRVMFNTPEQFVYPEEDLKQALKRLKEEQETFKCPKCSDAGCDDPIEHQKLLIDKIFGEELTNE